jgi:hypothetical protein
MGQVKVTDALFRVQFSITEDILNFTPPYAIDKDPNEEAYAKESNPKLHIIIHA